MKKSLIVLPVIAFLVLPVAAFAVNYETWVSDIMKKIITPVWQFFFGISVIMFIFAGILFVTSNGEPGKITTARNAVIWGIVGIIVATIAFVIVNAVSGWVG